MKKPSAFFYFCPNLVDLVLFYIYFNHESHWHIQIKKGESVIIGKIFKLWLEKKWCNFCDQLLSLLSCNCHFQKIELFVLTRRCHFDNRKRQIHVVIDAVWRWWWEWYAFQISKAIVENFRKMQKIILHRVI